MKSMSVVLAALALSVIGMSALAQAAPPRLDAHAASSTKITVTAVEFKFSLSKSSLSKPGTVTFDIVNKGHVQHDFKINGATSKLIGTGKSTTLTTKFTKKGRYFYECTVAGHAALGMKGYFTVK